MKTLIISFTAMMLCSTGSFSQTVYKIPFASSGNKIELTVSNTSSLPAKYVNIKAAEYPSWIKIKEIEQAVGEISSNDEKLFVFEFDVDKKAPVNKEETIKFLVTSGESTKGTSDSWSKEIKIKAGAPDRYELYQNYPNPFNPSTTISYQLPQDSRVTVKIYDVLGREVSKLLDEDKVAGYYEQKFSASRYASGIYIYRLMAKSKSTGNEFTSIKKMLLLK